MVLVQDLVLDCLEAIAGGSFRTNYQTFNRFSVLGKPARDSISAQVREWVNLYGNKHPAVGILALNEWKPITARLFILEELQSRYPGILNSMDYLKRWAAEATVEDAPALGWRMASLGDRSLFPKVREAVRTADHRGGRCLAVFGDPSDFLVLQGALRRHLLATNTTGILSAHILVNWVAEVGSGLETNKYTPADARVADTNGCGAMPASYSREHFAKNNCRCRFPGIDESLGSPGRVLHQRASRNQACRHGFVAVLVGT